MGSFELLSLPYELKRRTATFLSSRDAIRMTQTCRTLHWSMLLGCLEPIPLFENVEIAGDRVRGDEVRQGHFIPIIASRRVHSVTVAFTWVDQGWGNRKGKVYIVGSTPDQQPPPSDDSIGPFDGGRLVYESELASHTRESLKISFSPVEGERYHLWYKAGAGGSHRLRLNGGTVTIVVFDDSERSFTHNYRVLLAAGLLEPIPAGAYFPRGLPTRTPATTSTLNGGAADQAPARRIPAFYPNLLLSLCRSMRRQIAQNGDVDDEVIGFFVDYDIPITESSLMAIEELIQENVLEQARAQEDQNRRNSRRESGVNNRSRIGGLAMQMEPGGGVRVFDPHQGGWVDIGEEGGAWEPPMPIPLEDVNLAEFLNGLGVAGQHNNHFEQFNRLAQQLNERIAEIADLVIPGFDDEQADGDDGDDDDEGHDDEGEHMD